MDIQLAISYYCQGKFLPDSMTQWFMFRVFVYVVEQIAHLILIQLFVC
jgi:hypothetical protein